MNATRVMLTVSAGILPGQVEPTTVRRYSVTAEEWEATAPADQARLLGELSGKAQGYATLLMLQPDRYNWVTTEWVWM